jgi:hypothetical protein
MDDAQGPELYEGDLDDDALDALFMDLAACAEIQNIRTRGAAAADGPPASLEVARSQLGSGAVTAVQILYRFEGEGWCDTLMVRPEGVRLVRVRAEGE